MKPLVIYISGQEIKLTKEEFEQFLKEAYEAGHSDGYNEGYTAGKSISWWNSPTINNPPTISNPTIRWDNPTYDPYKITCCDGETANSIGD